MVVGDGVGDRLGGALEIGRVGGGDRDRLGQDHAETAVRLAGRDRTGTMRDMVLAARVAGPAGNVVQASNSFTGMPSLR